MLYVQNVIKEDIMQMIVDQQEIKIDLVIQKVNIIFILVGCHNCG